MKTPDSINLKLKEIFENTNCALQKFLMVQKCYNLKLNDLGEELEEKYNQEVSINNFQIFSN